MKIEKKYNLKDIEYSFVITDILMYCLYCIQKQKKQKKRITINNLWRNLYHYDYSYKTIKHEKLKNIIVALFPLRQNNHKNTKFFKVNKSLVDYWGEKFGISYKIHTEIFSTFKSLENEN